MKKTQSNTIVKQEDNSMIMPLEMRMRSLGDGERYLASFNARNLRCTEPRVLER